MRLVDLGYVTIDLGETVEIDALKLKMGLANGKNTSYCNFYVGVWGEGEPEPSKPNCPGRTQPPRPTPAPSPKPTNAPKATQPPKAPRHCYQCGEKKGTLTLNTYCDGMDLIMPPSKECPPGKDICMNDLYLDYNNAPQYIRRCGNRKEAIEQWWEGSSDKPLCTGDDPTLAYIKATCSYACLGDNCNDGEAMPDKSKIWKPDSDNPHRRLDQSPLDVSLPGGSNHVYRLAHF